MEIEGLISSVGFPIAAFLLMYWQNNQVLAKLTAAIDRLELALSGAKIIKAK